MCLRFTSIVNGVTNFAGVTKKAAPAHTLEMPAISGPADGAAVEKNVWAGAAAGAAVGDATAAPLVTPLGMNHWEKISNTQIRKYFSLLLQFSSVSAPNSSSCFSNPRTSSSSLSQPATKSMETVSEPSVIRPVDPHAACAPLARVPVVPISNVIGCCCNFRTVKQVQCWCWSTHCSNQPTCCQHTQDVLVNNCVSC